MASRSRRSPAATSANSARVMAFRSVMVLSFRAAGRLLRSKVVERLLDDATGLSSLREGCVRLTGNDLGVQAGETSNELSSVLREFHRPAVTGGDGPVEAQVASCEVPVAAIVHDVVEVGEPEAAFGAVLRAQLHHFTCRITDRPTEIVFDRVRPWEGRERCGQRVTEITLKCRGTSPRPCRVRRRRQDSEVVIVIDCDYHGRIARDPNGLAPREEKPLPMSCCSREAGQTVERYAHPHARFEISTRSCTQ